MRGYTCLAPGWQAAPEVAGEWVSRALAYTSGIPSKLKAPARGRGGPAGSGAGEREEEAAANRVAAAG
jgi:hypothetical protein